MGYLSFGPDDYVSAYLAVRRPEPPARSKWQQPKRRLCPCGRTFSYVQYNGALCLPCRVKSGELPLKERRT